MCIKAIFSEQVELKGTLVAFASANKEILGSVATDLDSQNNGFIKRAINASGIEGKFGEIVDIISPTDDIKQVVVICIGEKPLGQVEIENLGGKAYKAVLANSADLTFICDGITANNCDDISARLVYGAVLKSWNFDKYKTAKKDKKITNINAISSNTDQSNKIWGELSNVVQGVFFAREAVSEPANVLYPESFADIIVRELLPLGIDVSVLNEDEMRDLGMGALLGVAQGSTNPPKLVVMRWNGGQGGTAAFIGKGVMFDSGGLDIKPYPHMEGMKGDMAGAAAVVGLLKTAALNKLPQNIVGVVGLVENMPSGTAQKSGDIVKSMSGQTIEVLNTDAEGRLTLADVLWYTQDKFNPDYMVDLATLTGAIVYCLGDEYAGLFSNDSTLSENLTTAGNQTGEKLWQLPMNDYYDSTIKSDIADLKNITSPGVKAGSITAAQFLKRFVNNVKWAHLDIAGVETSSRSHDTFDAGATGFGVRLLYQLLKNKLPAPTTEEQGNTAAE